MTTDYDPIAQQYKRSKLQPWRENIEAYTLLGLVGDLCHQSAVDLACGEGFYTRLLAASGAAQVIGVDVSAGMVELARAQETAQPLGIKYVRQDVRELDLPAECDLAVVAYLLNYAHDAAELAAMCHGVARALKPGGRFVTVNMNPAADFLHLPSYRKYGFETALVGDLCPGSPVTWTFYLSDSTFDIENYYLDVATHEAALRAAGFREIRWCRPRLSPRGADEFGSDFWATIMNDSPIAFIECVK